MYVLQGLDSRDLWRPIMELGWHPILRHSPHITFRAPSGRWGGLGTLRVRAGEAFGQDPLPAMLAVLHAPEQKVPWILLTDTPPTETKADLYAWMLWAAFRSRSHSEPQTSHTLHVFEDGNQRSTH